MPQILADRFVLSGGQWVDLATGDAVRVRVAAAGPVRAQLEWNTRCASLAGIRHPLINPLIDYGMADAAHTFEAYSVTGSLRADARSAACLRDHLARFLGAHDLHLESAVREYALRGVTTATGEQPRALGIALQPRRAFHAIQDALEAGMPPGASAVAITGEPHSGLRTLRLAAARTARLEGYMPAAASVLGDRPWLNQALGARHVCLFSGDESPGRTSIAAALGHLAVEGARRHVVLSFRRGMLSSRSVQVERMGISAMTEMVYIDVEHGPRADRLFEAARASNGRPGEFLARLGATELRTPRVSFAVHETVQPYDVGTAHGPVATQLPGAGAVRGVLRRAPERSEALARLGRHGAARRLLRRAERVLTERGDHTPAADCALQLGWLSLERAQLTGAVEHFGRARELTSHPPTTVRAAIGLGIAWTDEGRLTEAEGVLRTSVVGAKTMGEGELEAQAEAGLARCLLWQGRHDEAAALLQSPPGPGVSARELGRRSVVLARVLMAEGGSATAVRTARQAVEHATKSGDASVLASAHRALGEAVAGGGDATAALRHVHEGLRVAQRAHLPLQVARLRVASLDIEASGGSSDDHRRLAARLVATADRWPPLLRHLARAVRSRVSGEELDEATRAFIDATGALAIGRPAYSPGPNPVAELERLLAMCQTATDDRTAIQKTCDYLRARLRAATVIVIGPEPERRVISTCGRPWHGTPSTAWRTLASGLAVRADPIREPCEASEPLRYSGDITGAIAARWSAGAVLDPVRAGTMLRVGALAIAANVRAELDRTAPSPATAHPANEILGDSPPAQSMRESIARAARAPFPVLIEGESGSGKELVARAIHRLGPRRDRRFCAINCAALSDELLEAELFGHARGAFTGAVTERAGLFEEADGGTLFLDEIGELSARAQAKLLRVLQDGQVRRVGENMSRRVDVRIVAATNRRLAEEAAAGRFRADLRFRLDVVRIDVPPLRERASDVPLLASSFWTEAAARMGSRATLSPETLAALSRYDWPGNVRELQNVIAWMAVHSPTRGRIQAGAVPAHVAQAASLQGNTFEAARSEFERRLVRAALASAGGHRARAAQALGVTRQGLAKMLRRLGIE